MFIAHDLREGSSQFWLTPDVRMGVHHFQYLTDDFCSLPHTHPEYNLVISLSGRMEFIRSMKRVCMKAGEIIMLNPGEVHQSWCGADKSPCEIIGLVLDKSELEKILLDMKLPAAPKTHQVMFLGKAHDMKVVHLAEQLLYELRERNKGFGLVVQSLVVQILVHLLRHCLEPTWKRTSVLLPHQLPHWELTRAIEYMNTRGNSNFSLLEICSDIGSSSSRFVPLFRNSTGLTPHHYFDRLLIQKAQKLLKSGEYSIKEVAYELGFRNLSYFYGFFRSMSGVTPKAYQVLEKAKTASNSGSV